MESWRKVWRVVAPQLSTQGLLALRNALQTDDSRLLQGATTSPPPLQCTQDWPCEAACLIAYPSWQGDSLEYVADVEERFAQICYDTDQALGEPAGCRWLMNWFDETPRQEMIAQLLPEVELALAQRNDA